MPKNGSKSGVLDNEDFKALIATSLKVGAAAALTYFGQNVSGIDFGANSAVVVSILVIAVDMLTKFLKDNTK